MRSRLRQDLAVEDRDIQREWGRQDWTAGSGRQHYGGTGILHDEVSKTEKQGLVPEKPGGKNRGADNPRKAAGALS